jgi:hypothetical protein
MERTQEIGTIDETFDSCPEITGYRVPTDVPSLTRLPNSNITGEGSG